MLLSLINWGGGGTDRYIYIFIGVINITLVTIKNSDIRHIKSLACEHVTFIK